MKCIARFVASRKKELVRAVMEQEFTAAEIKSIYAISDEEWESWVRAYSVGGKMTMSGMINSRNIEA